MIITTFDINREKRFKDFIKNYLTLLSIEEDSIRLAVTGIDVYAPKIFNHLMLYTYKGILNNKVCDLQEVIREISHLSASSAIKKTPSMMGL